MTKSWHFQPNPTPKYPKLGLRHRLLGVLGWKQMDLSDLAAH